MSETRDKILYSIETAKERLIKQSTRHREIKNKNRQLRTLKPEQQVLVLLPNAKNENIWEGPYKVEEKLSDVTYSVNIKGYVKKLHIDKLKAYGDNKEEKQTVNVISKEEDENEIGAMKMESSSIENISFDIPEGMKNRVMKIFQNYKDVITKETGNTKTVTHKIQLLEHEPYKTKVYPIPIAYRDTVKQEIDYLLKENKIRKAVEANYTSPTVIVKKKNGKIRLCCDYRQLNSTTKLDHEPIGDPRDIVDRIGNSKIFTTFDLNRGFWQINMDPTSIKYTAFVALDEVYEWLVMPFGLVNSTATFSRFMKVMLKGIPNVVHYVDDICIHTKDWETHIHTLEMVLNRLKKHNVTISPEKMNIGKRHIDFLGYRVGGGKVTPTTENENKIFDLSVPRSKKQVQALLGLCNFYRPFIANFAEIVHPLTEIIKKTDVRKFHFPKECFNALEEIKNAFRKKPILVTPQWDKPFIVATDASSIAVGACLMQEHEGILHPIQYLSRNLTKPERNYSTIERECLAIVWALQKLQKYLLGRTFTLLTDHKPLVAFNKKKISNEKINRWAMLLADYKFDIKPVKGSDNVVADVLSRLIRNKDAL